MSIIIARRRRARQRTGIATVTDPFARADNAASMGSTPSGQAWSALSGTWGISSSQAYNPSATTDSAAAIDYGQSNVTVSVTLNTAVGSSGLCFRATDGSNYLRTVFFSGSLYLQKRVAGVNTDLNAPLVQAVANGDVLSVICSGTSIIVKLNGTTKHSVTDSTFQTATKHGLACSTGDATLRWDNFSVSSP